MSLLGSDQAMMNASVASIIYSASIGAMETANIVNADTIAHEKFRAEMKEQEEQKNDSLDSAITIMTTAQQDALERIRDGHMSVSYNNGIFTINGVDIEEEALEKTLKDVDNNFDAFAAKHGLEGAEAAQFHMLVQAFNQTDDPDQRMQYLQDMAKINPDATHDIVLHAANDSDNILDNKMYLAQQNSVDVSNDLSSGKTSVDSILSSSSDADINRVVAQVDDMELRSTVVSAKGYASAQADDLAASDISSMDNLGDMFGDVASGEPFSVASNDIANTQSVPVNAPTATI